MQDDISAAPAAPLAPGIAAIPAASVEDLAADPHGTLRACRAKGPLMTWGEGRVYVLHARNVMALASDPRAVQIPGEQYVRMAVIPDGVTADFLRNFMLMSNGPDHARRRAPVNRAFAQPVVRALRPEIGTIARRIAAGLPRGEDFDFVENAAARIPAEVIAGILGLPHTQSDRFRRLVYSVSRCLAPPYDLAAHDEIEAAAAELLVFVEAALEARRSVPSGDLLSALAGGEGGLAPRDLAFQVFGLLLAGSDTTRAGIAMTLSLLLERPEDWAAVKADPALIQGAVAEAMRFEPPIGSLPRFLPEPIEIDGMTAPRGTLFLSTLSAMRDEEAYPDPDRFDIRRAGGPKPHIVFGGGAHRCLGEMLARIEMEEALAAMIETAPDIELVAPARMAGFGGIRKILPMKVRIPA